MLSDTMGSQLEIEINESHTSHVRRRLIIKYNSYFSQWRDFYILTSFLALVGLILTSVEWEASYKRDEDGAYKERSPQQTLSQFLVLILTLLCILACYMKQYCNIVWSDFKNPLVFYKELVLAEHKMGETKEKLTENYFSKMPRFFKVVSSSVFLWEVFILLLMPYPFDKNTKFFNTSFTMQSVNWIENGSIYSSH